MEGSAVCRPRAGSNRSIRQGDRPRTTDRARYDYQGFSELAGPLQSSPAGPVKVRYRRLPNSRPLVTLALLTVCLGVEIGLFAWLLNQHPTVLASPHDAWLLSLTHYASLVMVAGLFTIEALRVVNVFVLARATVVARDPVPLVPEEGRRIAFITTIVPSKEPIAMARKTLAAATEMAAYHVARYGGTLDVWLLDEGNDDRVKAMCAELGVLHFSRHDTQRWGAEQVRNWNQPAGTFKTRSKHGNYNAWLFGGYQAYGREYDYWVSVDTDHVPVRTMAERLVGYFRDPEVAFVIGPQVYGNFNNWVTRAAESQQFMFHSLVQRAGNATRSPMLVGTNNAFRISALKSIGGLVDSITEDIATSLTFHHSRNPVTGRRWESVYTPDVLAVGEGPSSWTDYNSQQLRWARGTNEVLRRSYWRVCWRLSPRQALHYCCLMSHYPTTAAAWMLGGLINALYLVLGSNGLGIPAEVWIMLYFDAAAFQVGIYLWNRRHNVSPHEEAGSSGFTGMLITTLTNPIYVTALITTVLGRPAKFVVTAKGDSMNPDSLSAFRKHLQWAAAIVVLLAVSEVLGHTRFGLRIWSVVALAVCLLPVVIWQVETRYRMLRARADRRTLEQQTRPNALLGRATAGVRPLRGALVAPEESWQQPLPPPFENPGTAGALLSLDGGRRAIDLAPLHATSESGASR